MRNSLRMYSGRICGPSRAALQSGRNPIHVNIVNDALGEYNLDDPVSGYNGMPLNMTGIASKDNNMYVSFSNEPYYMALEL